MTNDQLRMFIAVAEQGSYRRAAEIVCKTQSTVSFAVKTLENDLRFQLFSRDGYRSQLTPRGEAFLLRAKQVIEQADSLQSLGRQLAAGVEPEFIILISGICPMPRILARIKSVIDVCPETDFNITVGHLGGIYEQLNNGDADLAFTPPLRADLRHDTRTVGRITMVTVAAPGYLSPILEETIPWNRLGITIRLWSAIRRGPCPASMSVSCRAAKHGGSPISPPKKSWPWPVLVGEAFHGI